MPQRNRRSYGEAAGATAKVVFEAGHDLSNSNKTAYSKPRPGHFLSEACKELCSALRSTPLGRCFAWLREIRKVSIAKHLAASGGGQTSFVNHDSSDINVHNLLPMHLPARPSYLNLKHVPHLGDLSSAYVVEELLGM